METTVLRTDELDYHLPPELIATHPAESRDAARLLVVRRGSGAVEHRTVRDLPEYLRPNDIVVLNRTAVAPARLVGRKADSGGRVEGLFLCESAGGTWEVLLRGRGRLRPGHSIELLLEDGQPAGITLRLLEKLDDVWKANVEGAATTADALARAGRTPLPPYILRARGAQKVSDASDRAWYQTTYADAAQQHSVAAPTAGLHFTDSLLESIRKQGVRVADLVLHVGAGTFKPVTARTLDEHRMHRESFHVPPATVALLGSPARETLGASGPDPRADRPRIVAVGTTTVRTLESLPENLAELARAGRAITGATDLLIAPPYQFRHVDAMLTNFHLPRSTLLALVAALVGLGRIKQIYQEAIERRYRFYSYGDAMLILP